MNTPPESVDEQDRCLSSKTRCWRLAATAQRSVRHCGSQRRAGYSPLQRQAPPPSIAAHLSARFPSPPHPSPPSDSKLMIPQVPDLSVTLPSGNGANGPRRHAHGEIRYGRQESGRSMNCCDRKSFCSSPKFSNETACAVGLSLVEIARSEGKSVTVDVRRNGHQLFHFALPGTAPDNDHWILRKARVVNRFGHSSFTQGGASPARTRRYRRARCSTPHATRPTAARSQPSCAALARSG